MSAGRVPFFCLSLFCYSTPQGFLVSPAPRVYCALPHIHGGHGSNGGMWLATHVQHKDAELGLGVLALEPQLLPGGLDVLLQLLDGVLEGGAGVVDLVDDEDLLAYEVLHLAEAGQVEPLGAGDGLPGLLDDAVAAAEGLVERQADGLDGDVGAARLLEEGPQDARGHVAPAADGDHEVRLEVVEDVGGGLLAELVDLEGGGRQESETRILRGVLAPVINGERGPVGAAGGVWVFWLWEACALDA